MNSDTSKGGIATPERPPSSTQIPRTEHEPAPYPPLQTPDRPMPYQYRPTRASEPKNSHVAAWIVGGVVAFVVLASLIAVLVASLVGGILTSTIGQRERSVTSSKTFTVSQTPTLVITDAAGNVTIQQGSGSVVTVQVTKHAWGSSDADAQSWLNRTTVDVTQNANTITVNEQHSGTARRSVDLLITVPSQANANVHLGAGNIEVRGITGSITVDIGAGNLTASGATFSGTSRLHTGAGNITGDGAFASGAAVNVLVGAGNATLTLPSNTPAHLTASTGVGNMTITGWQIPVSSSGFTGHSASGDLGADATGTLAVQIGTGNVTLMSR